MFRKPLLRLGVRLCFRPSISMNSGSTEQISDGVQPERPFTSSAARPLVSCASESAFQYILPSRTSGITHTWLTQPCTHSRYELVRGAPGPQDQQMPPGRPHTCTLWTSVLSPSSSPSSLAAKYRSCL